MSWDLLAEIHSANWSTDMPSTPALPLLDFTFRNALFRFPLSHTRSIMLLGKGSVWFLACDADAARISDDALTFCHPLKSSFSGD